MSGVTKFVGRAEELSTLHQQLQENDCVGIVAIAGMGGVGKTELALNYAMTYLQAYTGGICWLLPKSGDVGLQIVQFARTYLDLNPSNDLDLPARVQYCWQFWREGTVLLIFDDVSDYEQVKPYLPSSSSRFKVLLTSRQRLGNMAQLTLNVLQPEAALELLVSIIGRERIERENDPTPQPSFPQGKEKNDLPQLLGEELGKRSHGERVALRLCEWLGYLPLGVELVGRYLVRKPDLSLAKMQQRLEKQQLEQAALVKTEADMTAQRGVLAAFELSWRELTDVDQKLCCLLSVFAPAPIPWNLVEDCVLGKHHQNHQNKSPVKAVVSSFKRAVSKLFQPQDELFKIGVEDLEVIRDDKLLNLHLLQYKEPGIYQLHPLLRQFFRSQLRGLQQRDKFRRSVCKVMVAVAKDIPQDPILEQIKNVAPAIPHIAEVANNLIQYVRNDELYRIFTGNGRFYDGQGLYEKAAPWYEQCLKVMKQRLGAEHPYVATSLNNLAFLYYSQGRYSEAEPLYSQALALYRQLLGEEHPYVATSLNNLAALYKSQGRYSEAEPLYSQALALHRKLLGEEHSSVATSLNNLAGLYDSQGRYSEAEPLYSQALALRRKLLGAEHPDVAASLNNLAGLYKSQGRYSEAEPLLSQALTLYRKLLGEEHPLVATSLNNLALFYKSQGRYSEAEPLYSQALELLRKLLSGEHPDVATSLNDLAGLYYYQGRYSEAEPLYSQALALRRKLLGAAHPDVATSLNNLAVFYYSQGRYSEAEPFYSQALALTRKLLGEEHPDVATSLNNLALFYKSQGRYSEAEPFYSQALALRRKLLGEEHPDVATSLNNLAGLYKSQGRYSEAEPLYSQALALNRKLLGEEHPDVATSLNNLAVFYYSQGRYSEAEPLYSQALDILERRLGVNHPNTVTARENLAYLREHLNSEPE